MLTLFLCLKLEAATIYKCSLRGNLSDFISPSGEIIINWKTFNVSFSNRFVGKVIFALYVESNSGKIVFVVSRAMCL